MRASVRLVVTPDARRINLTWVLPEDEIPTRKRAAAKLEADENTDWKAHVNNLEKFKADDLRAGCVKHGVKKSGNKKAIIERLREAILASED